MQVTGNGLGFDAEESFEMLHPLLERFQRFIIFHVADMVTEESIILMGNAKGVL